MDDRVDFHDDLPNNVRYAGTVIARRIANQFPDDADFGVGQRNGGLLLRINWPLHNDPNRPSKLSKIIHLIVSQSAVLDYLRSAEDLSSALDAIAEFVRLKLAGFDPTYDNPAGTPPVEEWHITSAMLRPTS